MGDKAASSIMSGVGKEFLGSCSWYRLGFLSCAAVIAVIGLVCILTPYALCDTKSFACQVSDMRQSTGCMTNYLLGGEDPTCSNRRSQYYDASRGGNPSALVPTRPPDNQQQETPNDLNQMTPPSAVMDMRSQTSQQGYTFM